MSTEVEACVKAIPSPEQRALLRGTVHPLPPDLIAHPVAARQAEFAR